MRFWQSRREPCGISILGDSISSWRLSFWHILREALRGYPAVFHDFSVSGQKSGDLLAAMYPDIARAHAQLAHIMIGTNDCRRTLDVPNVLHTGLPEYEKNVRFLVFYNFNHLQEHGFLLMCSFIAIKYMA